MKILNSISYLNATNPSMLCGEARSGRDVGLPKTRGATDGSLSIHFVHIVLWQSFVLLTGEIVQAHFPLPSHLSHRSAPIVLRQTLGLKPYAGEIVQAHFPLPSHLSIHFVHIVLRQTLGLKPLVGDLK